jgi:hypothetical protein
MKPSGNAESVKPHVTEGSDVSNASVHWFMAALLLAGAGGAAWMMRSALTLDFQSRDFNPLIFVPLALAAIGVVSLARGIRAAMRGRRFGTSTMALDREEGRLGEKLTGTIRTSARVTPTGAWQLTLRCIEQIEKRELTSPTKSRMTDYVRWEARRHVDPATVDSSRGIPFAFDIPTVALANGDARAKGQVRWILEITAPMSGVDYYEIFGLVVRPQR